MHADTAILTGSRHTAAATPCQDYATAGTIPNGLTWGIIADGCSTGKDTDLGARAWALAAREVLKIFQDFDATAEELRHLIMETAAPMLSLLDNADGFATLGILQAQGKRVRATMFGDGVLIARHSDASITFINLMYTENAPFYLNYLRKPEGAEAWRATYGGQLLRVVTQRLDAAGALVEMKVSEVPCETPWVWQADIDSDDIEMVMLATDGATDCGNGLLATIAQFAAVKNPAGEFIKRRVARLARDWQKSGHMPADDLAVAAIWLNDIPPATAPAAEANHG
jgi:hypothetical protein